jgi:hypothetical protein
VNYQEFLYNKSHYHSMNGFEPLYIPNCLMDFQKHIVNWAVQKGRCAIFADCGLGKTLMQLVWAQNIVEKTNGRVLIITPLAVGAQTVKEGNKFGIETTRSKEGDLNGKIIITNYERLHYFNPSDFAGCVCDESSILKHFTGATQKQVTRFMCKLSYRLLCTATAAPNDYTELGTSSEALGEMNYSDMLHHFFRQLDDKGQKMELRKQNQHEKEAKHFARLAYRVSQTISQWRLKHHAFIPFWKWICSWAIACRKPQDIGYEDDRFILPPINKRDHVIIPDCPPDGMLFTIPAFGLKEERDERRRTMKQRCEFAAELVNHNKPAVLWCHMNEEGKTLAKIIPGAREIAGSTPDDEKEEIYNAFSNGELRVLVIKPKIGAWGLNWQHCAHIVTFASHSYEQYYQSVRRCWRFGQLNPVTVDIISTEGEIRTRESMERKAFQADQMFNELVKHMNSSQRIEKVETNIKGMEVPQWLKVS